MKFLLKGCLKGCLLPLGIFWGMLGLLGLVLQLHWNLFGDGAKQKSWLKSNRLLAVESAALCRDAEKDVLMDDAYSWLRSGGDHKLKPSSFESIRFYDLDSGAKLPPSYSVEKNYELSLAADYNLVLRWRRQFTYIGNNPPLFFDPHYDFVVTCYVSKDPLKVVGFSDVMVGQ